MEKRPGSRTSRGVSSSNVRISNRGLKWGGDHSWKKQFIAREPASILLGAKRLRGGGVGLSENGVEKTTGPA